MTFAEFNLNHSISKALSACGYTKPTPIQIHTIPEILKGKDIVATAQTGSGKTAAFVLPALERVSKVKGGAKPRILILTPTRELATQITQAASKYGKFLKFTMVSLVGGMPYRQQLKGLSRPLDIIVATPGRLLDHMGSRRLDLSGIEMFILDEADRMLDMGFIDDIKVISKATPKNRQTLLFSATVDSKLANIIKQLLKNPLNIDLSNEKKAPVEIKQELYITDNMQHKSKLLKYFLNEIPIFKAIIFSATKVNVDKLSKELRAAGFSAMPLHGDLKQKVRNKTVELLRQGKVQFLVATDVAARGLDISDVSHVFNYDLPRFCEDYVHRIGRTGRAGKKGIAISFALPSEGRQLQKIERFVGERITFATIAGLESARGFQAEAGTKNKKPKNNRHKNQRFSRHNDEKSRPKAKFYSGEKKDPKARFHSGEKKDPKAKSYSKDSRKEKPYSNERSNPKKKSYSKERSAFPERARATEKRKRYEKSPYNANND